MTSNDQESQKPSEPEHLDLLQNILSDQANGLVNFGIGTARLAFILNGGSVIILMTLAGAILSSNEGNELATRLVLAGKPFAWGALLAAAAIGLSYFFQLARIRETVNQIEEVGNIRLQGMPGRWLASVRPCLFWLMVIVFLGAFVLFTCGALSVFEALEVTRPSN